ncbi:hypothetical protein ACWN8V_06775 [Vagococcus elongatus]|nr:hypothetical protein [Vagococcus elongatus]
MNKRQKKKYMDRRYEIVEGEPFCFHLFETGDVVMWTGEIYQKTGGRVFRNSDGIEQIVRKKDLKRSYKKFK